MKTLSMWKNENNVVVARHGHARCVQVDIPLNARIDLYCLDDYCVSGVVAGTIWLVRRKSFSDQEKFIRSNVRNYLTGKTILETESIKDAYAEKGQNFELDCADEFLQELILTDEES